MHLVILLGLCWKTHPGTKPPYGPLGGKAVGKNTHVSLGPDLRPTSIGKVDRVAWFCINYILPCSEELQQQKHWSCWDLCRTVLFYVYFRLFCATFEEETLAVEIGSASKAKFLEQIVLHSRRLMNEQKSVSSHHVLLACFGPQSVQNMTVICPKTQDV